MVINILNSVIPKQLSTVENSIRFNLNQHLPEKTVTRAMIILPCTVGKDAQLLNFKIVGLMVIIASEECCSI